MGVGRVCLLWARDAHHIKIHTRKSCDGAFPCRGWPGRAGRRLPLLELLLGKGGDLRPCSHAGLPAACETERRPQCLAREAAPDPSPRRHRSLADTPPLLLSDDWCLS